MGFFGRFSGKKYLATHEQLLAWEVKKIACELGVNESEVSFVVHKTDYGTETEFFINNKPVDEFQKEQEKRLFKMQEELELEKMKKIAGTLARLPDEVKEKLIQLKRKEMQKADDIADKEDDDEDYEPNGLDADDICKICRWPRRDHTTKNLGHSPDC